MKILVTLDGSTLSESVLVPASNMAKTLGAEVHLMRVGEPPPQPPASRRVEGGILHSIPTVVYREPVETYDQTIERAERELREYLEDKGKAFAGNPLTYKVALADDAAAEIIRYASREKFDLIIMATHGRSGLAAAVQGSVASEVVRSAVCPVMLVHPRSVST